jgi:hypothetical protein
VKALDAYRDTLKELDKYESPTFSIRDFNYFYNKAVSRYIDTNYAQLDVILKQSNDISSVTKLTHPLTLDASGEVTVPEDFRHLLALKVKVKFKKDYGRYKKDQQHEFWPERMKSGQKGFRHKSAFGRPKFNRYYYEIAAGKLKVLYDADVVEFVIAAPNAWLDYVIQPADVYLNPASNASYDDVAQNTVLIFNQGNSRNNVYFEIINTCRAIFLENIDSPRQQMAMQETALQQ